MTNAALRWILDHEAVTAVIPGFKNLEQVKGNLETLNTQSFSEAEYEQLRQFYQDEVAEHIRGIY